MPRKKPAAAATDAAAPGKPPRKPRAKRKPAADVVQRDRDNRRDVVQVIPSTCRRCGSTRRTGYTSTTRKDISGKTRDGQPFTSVVWRSCRCLDCDQARVDRTFENAPGN